MRHESNPGHADAPVDDPKRNAELLMQCCFINDRDCAYTTHGDDLAEQIEVARCMFCSKKAPELDAPWGAITVPDLQAWYDWHGSEIGDKEAKQQIQDGITMRRSDDYDVTMNVGVASRSVDVYAPRKYPYYAGMIWRLWDISNLFVEEIADRYRIDPALVHEIFNSPEWFVNSVRYDYEGRYVVVSPDGQRYSYSRNFYDQIQRVCMDNLPEPDLQPGDLL